MKYILFSSMTLLIATCAAKVDIQEELELMFPDDPSDDIDEGLELMFPDDPSDDIEVEEKSMLPDDLLDDIENDLESMLPDDLYLGLAEENDEEFKMPVVSDEETGIKKIDPTSCKNGKRACFGVGWSKAVIGANSCNNSEYMGCSWTGWIGSGVIGDGSCNGGRYECYGNGYMGNGYIGNKSCNTNGITRTCRRNGFWIKSTGKIGNNACNAKNACNGNRGEIASGCCNYNGACNNNRGTILPGSKKCLGTSKGHIQVGYYDAAHWWKLEDFSKLTPYKRDMVMDINFDKQAGEFATSGRSEYVAALFQGRIRFPRSGIYTLCLTSDDGSKLYMNGVTTATIDNDGIHPPEEKCTRYIVTRRVVSFKIEFFERTVIASLVLKWIVPGGKAKLVVPAAAYV